MKAKCGCTYAQMSKVMHNFVKIWDKFVLEYFEARVKDVGNFTERVNVLVILERKKRKVYWLALSPSLTRMLTSSSRISSTPSS